MKNSSSQHPWNESDAIRLRRNRIKNFMQDIANDEAKPERTERTPSRPDRHIPLMDSLDGEDNINPFEEIQDPYSEYD